ncbi:MAG: glutamate 5-kinase [Fusobacteriaceae bacterium]|jgi:glutamate 5-kinase|nr:glutamate 5-kinase [Fusobacteriaceae bacterium]
MDTPEKTIEKIKEAKKIVVKVGTSTLTHANGKINLELINRLSWVLTELINEGKEVILVTSGAIGVGATKLHFKKRPVATEEKQAAAAIGQASLMQIYQNFFNQYNQMTAQILLTKDDFKGGERKSNTTNTFQTLLAFGALPIVNNNDTISTDELGFSDNDILSAAVATLLRADLLILLTDIDALYDSNPKKNPEARRIPYVEKITKETADVSGGQGSAFSVGGMETKIAAAEICYENGVMMAIIDGSDPAGILDILNGKDIGTIFDVKN